MRFVLGVDEAGRGPLAGPVAVGAVAVPEGFNVAKEFPGVADSKALTEKKREALFALLEARAGKGDVRFRVEYGEVAEIDEKGIAVAIRAAVGRCLNWLAPDVAQVEVLLDGALRAPNEYRQKTIIGGDATVPVISLASIAAKVSRDRLMIVLAQQYPLYGFAQHKGYGTEAHFTALKTHGPCAIHRVTFMHFDNSA